MNKLKIYFITVFSAVTTMFSSLYVPAILMVCANITDYITGILAAYMTGKKITAKKGMRGIVKKVSMWVLLFIAMMLDILIKYSLKIGVNNVQINFLVSSVVAVWIVCNEMISILKNLAFIGIPLPDYLEPIIAAILKETEEKH